MHTQPLATSHAAWLGARVCVSPRSYKTPVVVQYPPCKVVVALVGEAVKRLGLQLAPLSDDHLTALAREFEGSIFTVTEAENKGKWL